MPALKSKTKLESGIAEKIIEAPPQMIVTRRSKSADEHERLLRDLFELTAKLETRVAERTAHLELANERLQTVSAMLVQAQESERRHLARELHDQIGQVLTGLHLSLDRKARSLPSEHLGGIREMQKVVADLMQQVRQLSLQLRPQVLDDLGLLPAVNTMLKKYQHENGIRLTFRTRGVPRGKLDSDLSLTLFRIVQESLTNIARHARTKRAAISLTVQAGRIHLRIADRGCGFEPEISMRLSCGLSGMKERVEFAGGTFAVHSKPGKGAILEAILPFAPQPQHESNRST